MFVPGKPLQPSLVSTNKAEAYPSEVRAFQVLHYRIGSWPHPQILDEAVKVLPFYEHLQITDTRSFNNIGPRSHFVALFKSGLDVHQTSLSLLRKSVNYGGKKFYSTDPVAAKLLVIKS